MVIMILGDGIGLEFMLYVKFVFRYVCVLVDFEEVYVSFNVDEEDICNVIMVICWNCVVLKGNIEINYNLLLLYKF